MAPSTSVFSSASPTKRPVMASKASQNGAKRASRSSGVPGRPSLLAAEQEAGRRRGPRRRARRPTPGRPRRPAVLRSPGGRWPAALPGGPASPWRRGGQPGHPAWSSPSRRGQPAAARGSGARSSVAGGLRVGGGSAWGPAPWAGSAPSVGARSLLDEVAPHRDRGPQAAERARLRRPPPGRAAGRAAGRSRRGSPRGWSCRAGRWTARRRRRMPSVTAAPMSPTSRPSKMNGQRMKASEAPTRRMISISSARAMTAMRMVLTTMKRTVSPTMSTMPSADRAQDAGDGHQGVDDPLRLEHLGRRAAWAP